MILSFRSYMQPNMGKIEFRSKFNEYHYVRTWFYGYFIDCRIIYFLCFDYLFRVSVGIFLSNEEFSLEFSTTNSKKSSSGKLLRLSGNDDTGNVPTKTGKTNNSKHAHITKRLFLLLSWWKKLRR